VRTTIHRVDGSTIEGANASEALRGLEFQRSLEPVRPGRYLVTHGLGEGEKECPSFRDALACYIDHQSDRGGARIFNLDLCDDDPERCTDGLTTEEREAIDLADELHCAELS